MKRNRMWIVSACLAIGTALILWFVTRTTAPNVVVDSSALLDGPARANTSGAPIEPAASTNSVAPKKFSSQFQDVDWTPWIKAMIAWLIERGDAESLTTAALLTARSPTSKQYEASLRQALNLLDRAVKLMPDDRTIRFIAMMLCNEIKDCDPIPYEQGLRNADPRNAHGWLGEFNRTAGNADARRSVLRAMAERERFDAYTMEIQTLVDRNMRAVRIAPPFDRTAEKLTGYSPLEGMIGSTAILAVPLPNTKPLTDFCRDTADARNACLSIQGQLRGSDTFFLQVIGTIIGRELLPADSDEGRAVAATRRRLDWLNHQIGRLHVFTTQLSEIHAGVLGEVEVFDTVLRLNGIDTKPPDDWVRPGSR